MTIPGAAWVKAQAARLRRKPDGVPPPDWRHVVIAAAVPVSLVAAIAGLVSYSHITALGLRTYQGQADSHLLAVPIDGLIVAGSVILAAGSSLGWLGIALGVAATLFANLQFGLPHGALSAAVSTWPAISFTVACFMLERWLRSRRRATAGDTGATMAPGSDTAATGAGRVRDILKSGAALPKADVAELAGVSLRTVERVKRELNGAAK